MSALRHLSPALRRSLWKPDRSPATTRLVSTSPARNSIQYITYANRKKQATPRASQDEEDPDNPFSRAHIPIFRRNTGVKRIQPTLNAALPVMLLRDMCTCPLCVDSSTRQKLFSTTDIPPEINLQNAAEKPGGYEISWVNDIPGFDEGHKSYFSHETFKAMATQGTSKILPSLPERVFWKDGDLCAVVSDIPYEAYMHDDRTLYKALQQLHTHGLMFLTGVPSSSESIVNITNRIGPLKNTFYGATWDVRSVPQPKNVAYTNDDLGFHMDLMYMEQPPHLQFLHCMRSSAKGGASLFADSFTAVEQLFNEDERAFGELQRREITFHYDHMNSHYYKYRRPLIELDTLRFANLEFDTWVGFKRWMTKNPGMLSYESKFKLRDWLQAVSWSPPFQGPFELDTIWDHYENRSEKSEASVRRWHAAARKFTDIIHQPENIHERTMKPGECVIFDNRRVLHARRAFEVGDAGVERWLRGSYLDKDPFMSKLRVLQHRFETRD